MNINFCCFSTYTSFIQEGISALINDHQNKILAIAVLNFGFLATYYFSYSFFKRQVKEIKIIEKCNFVNEEFEIDLAKDTIEIDDPKIRQITEDNLNKIQQDLLKAIKQEREEVLKCEYEWLAKKNPNLKTVKTYVAKIGFNDEGIIKSMEHGYPSVLPGEKGSHQLLLYSLDVIIKKADNGVSFYEVPKLHKGKLHFCQIHIQFTSDKENNIAPFSLDNYPSDDLPAQVMQFMVAKLNKRMPQAAYIEDFKKLKSHHHIHKFLI